MSDYYIVFIEFIDGKLAAAGNRQNYLLLDSLKYNIQYQNIS